MGHNPKPIHKAIKNALKQETQSIPKGVTPLKIEATENLLNLVNQKGKIGIGKADIPLAKLMHHHLRALAQWRSNKF